MSGPSPRAWGSLGARGHWSFGGRSIPTCVGFTSTPRSPQSAAQVYPHVRGVHDLARDAVADRRGPSPRAWGSGCRPARARCVGRSIPTCVGLGRAICRVTASSAVHPHVRGARGAAAVASALVAGPSPRAWGSGRGPSPALVLARSIPTCVGLGNGHARPESRSAVHPHVRGAREEGNQPRVGIGGIGRQRARLAEIIRRTRENR